MGKKICFVLFFYSDLLQKRKKKEKVSPLFTPSRNFFKTLKAHSEAGRNQHLAESVVTKFHCPL